jgi:hypothetical protein
MAMKPICGRPKMPWFSKPWRLCWPSTCPSRPAAANRFVLRTDVKSYYASIDHLLLLDQPAVHIRDRRVLNLWGSICGGHRSG